jgi:hypothetical protein
MVGCDCILGMGESAILSEELIRIINRQGIHHLYQAAENNRAGSSTSIWYSGAALNLSGQHLIEWELFRRGLINSGIQLHDLPDALIWTGGDQTSITSVKKFYLAVEKKKWTHTISGWKKALWSWACPLKTKIFIWLAVANRILTWEVLQHRGFIGPGYCILCKTNCETTHHLLVDCAFTTVDMEHNSTSSLSSVYLVGH